jgi:uncharacterized integral membrane protein (TIGR00698 family)
MVLAVVAWMSQQVSRLIVVGGSHPVEATMVGIFIGVTIRNAGLIPRGWNPHLKRFQTPLLWGIVLLGAGFTFRVAQELPLGLVVMFVTMVLGFSFVYIVGRRIGLPEKLSVLLAVGTTICGGSAIAITAPLIRAEEEETSYAVGTIVIAAFLLLVSLPFLGSLLDLSQTAFGIWAGTSVHNTPQTIGTGHIYGELAGQIATVVKLTRNMFMVIVALMVSVWFRAKEIDGDRLDRRAVLRAFPWFLFGYVAMAVFTVHQLFPVGWIGFFKGAGKFLILMGMVGIGFGTDFRQMRRFGLKPLLVGTLGTVVVTCISLGMITIFRLK